MAESQPSDAEAISLEELVALNDEIAALVRAGVPLDRGLWRLGGDLGGRLGRLAARLGEGLGRGQSLAESLGRSGAAFPPVYCAVVEAGLRTGRLAGALETVAASTRRLADARRTVVASMIYPLFVFLLAWGLFVLFVSKIASALLIVFEGAPAPAARLLEAFVFLRASVPYWGPAVPIAAVCAFGWWWHRASRGTLVEPATSGLLLGWLPWLGPMVRAFRQAAFAELLGLLVEHDWPLPEAIRMAAEATCTPKMRRWAEQVAAGIERGERLGGAIRHSSHWSPVLQWLLRSGHDRGTLLAALQTAAEIYHRRAVRLSNTAQLYLAPLVTLLIGGSATTAYVLLVFGTWMSLLRTVVSW